MKPPARTIDKSRLPADKSDLSSSTTKSPFFVRLRGGRRRAFGCPYQTGTKNRRLTLGTAAKEAFPVIRRRVLDPQAQVRLGTRDRGDAATGAATANRWAVIGELGGIERVQACLLHRPTS
jgi:hypothetical protein